MKYCLFIYYIKFNYNLNLGVIKNFIIVKVVKQIDLNVSNFGHMSALFKFLFYIIYILHKTLSIQLS